MMEVTRDKNADYAGFADDDPFANLSTCEKIGIAPTTVGILIRMTDKVSRINTYLKRGQLKVSDEGIVDTLLDLSNYSILLAGVITDKQNQCVNEV